MARYVVALENMRKPAEAPQAVQELEDLANKGVLTAKVDLGIAYLDGLGVKIDRVKAFELWEQAAVANEPRANERLGVALMEEAVQDNDKMRALKHLIIASVLYEGAGVDSSSVSAKRGSLAQSLRAVVIMGAIDEAKKLLVHR